MKMNRFTREHLLLYPTVRKRDRERRKKEMMTLSIGQELLFQSKTLEQKEKVHEKKPEERGER